MKGRSLFLILVSLCLCSLPAASQSGGGYELSWFTIDGGGGTSSGGDYSLTGTAGQAEVGALMRGGAYELAGGFWGAGREAEYDLYLPVVLRAYPEP